MKTIPNLSDDQIKVGRSLVERGAPIETIALELGISKQTANDLIDYYIEELVPESDDPAVIAKSASRRALLEAMKIMQTSTNAKDKLAAINIILDRAHGKPGQHIQADVNNFIETKEQRDAAFRAAMES